MSRKLAGIAAAPGFGRGPVVEATGGALEVPRFQPANLAAEKARLADARRRAAAQLHVLAGQVAARTGQSEAAVLEAQVMFLDDPALVARAEAAIEGGQNAELAWHEASEFFASQLDSLLDETLRARAADVRDASRRVVVNLVGQGEFSYQALQGVLVARDLAPSQTASLDRAKIVAFCTAEGGPTSHSAILARALGIPAVVGLGDAIMAIEPGTLLLVDGGQGEVWPEPDSETEAAFAARMSLYTHQRAQQVEEAGQPAVTRDGRRMEVVANVGSQEDAHAALKFGAEGIGLLRTEFLYLRQERPPAEDEQYAAYRGIFEIMGDRPVVIRTMDIGGDKVLPYLEMPREENPFLGWRAIRISLSRPDLFQPQLRAILRAAVGYDVRIMFPMIATPEEIRAAAAAFDEARAALISEGQSVGMQIQLGMMVEIPSAAVMADIFAQEVDFFSIGTNDLTQYTLAAERTNKKVSSLGDAIHPAVLRLIKEVCGAAHNAGRWVGVCGELGGDADAVPILLGLGVDELSVAPPLIPQVKAIVRSWTQADAEALASDVVLLDSAQSVRQAVRSWQHSE